MSPAPTPRPQLPKCLFHWFDEEGDEHLCNGPDSHPGAHLCICGAERKR